MHEVTHVLVRFERGSGGRADWKEDSVSLAAAPMPECSYPDLKDYLLERLG
jgi:hypothetical protein